MNERGRRAVRIGIFGALVGVEVLLAYSMHSSPSIRGYVDTRSYSVSASNKALVRKIDVALGDHVTAGQLIAELDGTSIESDMAVAMAERKRLIAAGRTGELDEDALRVVDTRLEQLAEKRDALRLKAPTDGIVESIDVRPGDVVSPDSPVASVVAADTRHVIACVPEGRIDEVDIGSTATVTAVVSKRHVEGTVESLTPAIAELPARCQPAVAKPKVYGRLAVITLSHAENLMPGESELIAFGARTGKPIPHISPEPVSPELVDVPPEIVAVSRVEASGLVWVPSLARYVVVSDETGSGNNHPPWLFTMSRRGVLDPEPMVVADVSELDDLESITAGDNNALWIASSQSASDRGNRPHARQVLARLVPDGASYKVDQKIHLFELLTAKPEIAKQLGVSDPEKLDIEGMAWHGGALYLGLKAPVDAQGHALIWKVAAPDKLLAGDVAGANISIFGTLPLTVTVDGAPVLAGISDLVFVSDNAFVIGATASGISAKHQDGAVLYVTIGANGQLSALPLQTFRDLRPEGLTLSPDAGKLTVVFDRGHEAPLWTTLELPGGGL